MQKEKLLANVEMEQNILSLLLAYPRGIRRVVDTLQPEHFYRDKHALIYKTMVRLYQQGRTITTDNVWDEIGRMDAQVGITWSDMLDLSNSANAAGENIEECAGIVIRKATMRRLAMASAEIAASAYAEDEDAVEKAEKLIYEIAVGANSDSIPTFAEALDNYMINLEQRIEDRKNGIARGLPTGFTEVDKVIGGLQPGTLSTLAALTGFGKSSWALSVAVNVIQYAKRVLFFSLEMSRDELIQRVLAMEVPTDQTFLRDGEIDRDMLQRVKARVQSLRQCDFNIDDQTFLLAGIKSKARQMHARKPLDLLVIDYLQMVQANPDGRSRHETRAEEIAKLSREMKRLARELNIPVLVLAQLNRDVDKRQTKEPQLSDINESGGIARDSDTVMFIYATEEEMEKRKQCVPHEVTLKIAKSRNSRTDDVQLVFSPRITKFRNDYGESAEEASND
jgi:replicative DNA helicase